MRYLPHTPDDVRDMLEVIGADSLDELFASIPAGMRLERKLELPRGLPECHLKEHVEHIAAANTNASQVASFVGAGIYNHYVPAAVGQLLLRSELYTAYTPYQPEVSQGTLQAIFEFQTMIARLLAMDVSNASLYDGSTAAAEAILMAQRVFRNKRERVVLAGSIHPEYLEVSRTYLTDPDRILTRVPPGADGRIDMIRLEGAMGDHVAGVMVQYPNFYGLLEDLQAVRRIADNSGALMLVVFSEPIAFGMLAPPGCFGADIVFGEGQSLGMPVSCGGPLLGIMTARQKYVRSIPGRLVGKTTDRHGNDAYVVTLATREQHIRRARATSNICTNEGLCAMSASIYMSLLGNRGLSKLAELNHHASRHLGARLAAIRGVSLPYAQTPWFNEFVVELPRNAADVFEKMSAEGVVPGVPLSRFFPDQENRLLVTTTELNSSEQMDDYCSLLGDLVA